MDYAYIQTCNLPFFGFCNPSLRWPCEILHVHGFSIYSTWRIARNQQNMLWFHQEGTHYGCKLHFNKCTERYIQLACSQQSSHHRWMRPAFIRAYYYRSSHTEWLSLVTPNHTSFGSSMMHHIRNQITTKNPTSLSSKAHECFSINWAMDKSSCMILHNFSLC